MHRSEYMNVSEHQIAYRQMRAFERIAVALEAMAPSRTFSVNVPPQIVSIDIPDPFEMFVTGGKDG